MLKLYGINYFEALSPITKSNSVKVMIFVEANLRWQLHYDVKNAFLHVDL